MVERKEGDHWSQLASVLGAEVDEQAPADLQEPQAQVEMTPAEQQALPGDSATAVPPTETEKPRRTRPPANWDALVSALGIESPAPAPSEQREAGSMEKPSGQTDEPPQEPPAPQAMSAKELAETVGALAEHWKAAPASLGHEPTVLIAEEKVTVVVELDDDGDEEGHGPHDGDEPSRDRPKRRRRRRPRAGEKQPIAETDETPIAATEMPEESEAADADSDDKRRGKRRRPRRRRQKSDAPAGKSGPNPEIEEEEAEPVDAFDSEESPDAGGRERSTRKAGHRSIPAWQEAIGIIVQKNLEGRSRKSGGSQSQKRGGRRSGRRGGGQNRS